MNVITSSSYYTAVRKHGVCQGTLWRQLENAKSSPAGSSMPTSTCDYSRLIGSCLECYESHAAWLRGEAPSAVLHVVGASAAQQASYALSSSSANSSSSSSSSHDTAFKLVTDQGTQFSCQATSRQCRDVWLAAFSAGLELLFMTTSTTETTTLTNNSNKRRLPPPPQTATVVPRLVARLSSRKYCISCGAVEGSAASNRRGVGTSGLASSSSSSSPTSSSSPAAGNSSALRTHTTGHYAAATSSSSSSLTHGTTTGKSIYTSVAPLPQYGMEGRVDLCADCATAQGLVAHTEFVQTALQSRQQELAAIAAAREACWKIVTTTCSQDTVVVVVADEKHAEQDDKEETRHACSALESREAPTATAQECQQHDATTETETKAEEEEESSSAVAGVIESSSGHNNNSNNSPDHSSGDEWSQLDNSDGSTPPPSAGDAATTTTSATLSPSGSWQAVLAVADHTQQNQQQLQQHQHHHHQTWIHLPPTTTSTTALMQYLQDPVQFGALSKLSPVLESLSQELLNGYIDVPDFLEQLDEAAGKLVVGGGSNNNSSSSLVALKKQAFRVAGDMGSAMKLLADSGGSSSSSSSSTAREESSSMARKTEVLLCILDFLLDLCQEGELSSVAFFWPQLCHLHLRMLPPENAAQVERVELMEDFLLTVATRYSVHLAMQLIWSHTADLEESLFSPTCAVACRRRRFAVLRFVCELESIIFDFDGCWGGGSVSLGRMLSPTGHQVEILEERIQQIQELRKTQVVRLTRSARLERLSKSQMNMPPEAAAQEKLRIAKNADYFSSHINFSRRLADIAEKLRFMDVNERATALEDELNLLNASGTMGGDPLNNVGHSLLRVVRVPSTEGHVFRSKERTPVLLLMEVVDDEAEVLLDTPEHSERGKNEGDNGPLLEIIETEFVEEKEEQVEPEENRSPTPPCCPAVLEGAGHDVRPSPKAGALRRFQRDDSGSSSDPMTPKKLVEKMVSSAVDQQLKAVDLPSLDIDIDIPTKSEARDQVTGKDDDVQGKAIAVRGVAPPAAGMVETLEAPAPENIVSSTVELIEGVSAVTDADEGAPVAEVSVNSEGNGSEGEPDPLDTEGFQTPKRPSPDRSPSAAKRISALGNLSDGKSEPGEKTNTLAPTGDVRREVLNTIMMRGVQGDTIAAGAAISLQKSLQELERKRATELLLKGDEEDGPGTKDSEVTDGDTETAREKLVKMGITVHEDEVLVQTEEDETMEAIRLLLIQNRVAQGLLSPADAAKVLQHISINRQQASGNDLHAGAQDVNDSDINIATVDAGDVDARLIGCGPVPPAVLQALTLWKGGMVTNAELLELVKKDAAFIRHSVLLDAENVDKLNEDSAFWGRFAFGERWAEKKARIGSSSPQGNLPGWDLVGVIVKSNDDLRQEAFVMQLIQLCQEAFDLAFLELWVSPYRILATGRTTGVIEMVRNAMSFDALKKRPGYGKGGLREHLQRMTEYTADPGEAFKQAQLNFVRSLAAYSLMSYFFLFKDRHNGNILLDTAGHVIHIDFGFVFGVAPGGSFSLEMSTPFKLTEEMLDVMGGLKSPLFSEFVTLFCCGFLALQSYRDTFLTLVEITCEDSTFKCFDGKDTAEIVSKLRERFCPDLSKEQTVSFALDLIKQATTSYGTKQYDLFQYMTQGIAA